MSSARQVRRVLLIVALASTGAPAAELALKDVGLRVETLPTEFDYTVRGPGSTISGSDVYRLHLGTALTGRWAVVPAGAWQGPVLGGELFQDRGWFPGGDSEMIGVRGDLGWGCAISRDASLLALARGGIGQGRVRFSDAGVTARGPQTGLGAETVLLWRLAPAWHAELALGWMRIQSTCKDGDLTVDFSQSGPTVALGLTWSVSAAGRKPE